LRVGGLPRFFPINKTDLNNLSKRFDVVQDRKGGILMSDVDSVQNLVIMVAGEIQTDLIQEKNVAENVLVMLKLIKENTVKRTM
jgi:hypothetical protein